ncbi:MAG: TGS domain-containing protein, partial [Chloroflexota bacterium]
DIKDCYASLGIVHTNWRPIPGQFDDYIAAPKENGYQSLHTCVIDGHGERFEVQIRTTEMDYSAEYGIAAHWRYKDGTKPDQALDQKIAAMRQAMHWHQEVVIDANEATDASDFVDGLKSDIIEERVYVFTPEGDVLNLPLGSTAIDFAYHIHTEVGHKCRGAKVNGKLVSLDYQLGNGDKVEILTAKRGGPSRDWLNDNLGYIKTSRARSKIRYWFKRQNFEDSISQGRSILERELKRLSMADIKIDDLSTICGYDSSDDFLAAVGFNDIAIQQVIRKAIELLETERVNTADELQVSSPPPAVPTITDDIQVKGTGNLLTHLANCCNPVPGDPVAGYITRGRGVTVHRCDCPNVLKVKDRERIIEVDWGIKEGNTHAVDLIIRAFDRPGLVRDISQVIANDQINIRNLDVITRRKNNTAELLVTLEVPDLHHLIKLMDKIEQLPNIIYLKRKGQKRYE